MADRGNVYIRRLANQEDVYTIRVSTRITEREYASFLRDLMRKTDQNRFFVDDSEISFREPARPGGQGGEG